MTNEAEVAEGSKDADARKVLYLTVIQDYLLRIRDFCIAQVAVVVDIVFGVDKVAERCIGEVCFVDGETRIYNFYNPLRILVKPFISIYVFYQTLLYQNFILHFAPSAKTLSFVA